MSKNQERSGDAAADGGRAVSTVKVCVRLLEAVNLPLREQLRFHGDLAALISDAIDAVDLTKAPLVVIRDKKVPDTTVRVRERSFKRLVAARRERGASFNVLVNTAVAHWLETKPRRRVRYRS